MKKLIDGYILGGFESNGEMNNNKKNVTPIVTAHRVDVFDYKYHVHRWCVRVFVTFPPHLTAGPA